MESALQVLWALQTYYFELSRQIPSSRTHMYYQHTNIWRMRILVCAVAYALLFFFPDRRGSGHGSMQHLRASQSRCVAWHYSLSLSSLSLSLAISPSLSHTHTIFSHHLMLTASSLVTSLVARRNPPPKKKFSPAGFLCLHNIYIYIYTVALRLLYFVD